MNSTHSQLKLLNQCFYHDIRKYAFLPRIINTWNSLPNFVVNVDSINIFQNRLDTFWYDQDIMFDYTAELTGIGDRSILNSLKLSLESQDTDIEALIPASGLGSPGFLQVHTSCHLMSCLCCVGMIQNSHALQHCPRRVE